MYVSVFKPTCMCVLSLVQLFVTPWTQAPLFMRFSMKAYWHGLTFPSLGDLPNPGIEPASLASPSLAGRFSTTNATLVFTFMPMPYYFD